MPSVDEKLLDEKLADLEQLRVWSPRLISKLESFVRTGDDWALFRANPFYFAEERCVSEDEAIDLFLLASKVGLFHMTWSLLCPGCGDAVQSFATLKNVCSAFHCYLCCVDVETSLDEFVHVGFTVSPKVRAIPAHDPAGLPVEDFYLRYHFTGETRLGPGGPRFPDFLRANMKGVRYIDPHTTASFDLDVAPGAMVAYDIITNAQFAFLIGEKRGEPNLPVHLKLQEGKLGAPPTRVFAGELHIEVENDSDQRNSIILLHKPQEAIVQAAQDAKAGVASGRTFDKFLSGRRLVTCHTFRQMFATETIRSSEGIGVRDVAILFTDLKGSTAMYDRIGDLKAFTLVNQHFERLSRAVTRSHGAVVKTIGDAVMASFERPADAVLAARDMLREIEAFNAEVGEREIVLKLGVHRGASIAVTLNERLDFFGQTVNIAARVQGLADADEIYITEDVYREPDVKDLLTEFHVTPYEARLRGVQRAVQVYRVATTPPAVEGGMLSA
jgi:class 3 adenylate cyclase